MGKPARLRIEVGAEVAIERRGRLVAVSKITRVTAEHFIARRTRFDRRTGAVVGGNYAYTAHPVTAAHRAELRRRGETAEALANLLASFRARAAKDPELGGAKHTDVDGWTISIRSPRVRAR